MRAGVPESKAAVRPGDGVSDAIVPDADSSDRDGLPETGDRASEENEFGEPPCAKPVDIGWNPLPDESAVGDEFASSAHDGIPPREPAGPKAAGNDPGVAPGSEDTSGGSDSDAAATTISDGEARWKLLVERIRKENLSLAASLGKAKEMVWSEGRLFISFGTEYEASVAKSEADMIRRTAKAAGMPPFSLEVATDGKGERPAEKAESRRVELVRRVFRGQVMKG